MRIYKYLMLFALVGGLFTSCSKDDDVVSTDDTPTEQKQIEGNLELEIKDFIWKGLNYWYLYKGEVPELADNAFSTESEYIEFLEGYSTPESFFNEGLLYEEDRFSWIVDDYEELENTFAGVRTTTGINYGLAYIDSDSNDLVGIIRYIVEGSPADMEGLQRGMLFTEIDGQQLTLENYRTLLGSETLTFGFAEFTENGIEANGMETTLTKVQLNENPILVAKTLDVDGIKVGYLMYNSFVHDYDDELNDVFAQFKNDGVTELVLDLRYNGGGRVSTAVDLASMITGQFKDKIIIRTKYNANIDAQLSEASKVTRFDDMIFDGNESDHPDHTPMPINSLNLDKVYVLATGSSASASELIINGLAPYINVVHVGKKTVGKVQASITLYDANVPYYEKVGLNPDHKYAMQPLISTSTNADGEAYPGGLIPDIEVSEKWDNFGTLGDPNEPLLAAALNDITSNRSFLRAIDEGKFIPNVVGESFEEEDAYRNMYIDVPAGEEFKKMKVTDFKD
ncbi:S41 family peptidase [Christiangramia sp. SM2212]|uniref:S41 family peptidase n=1 Tax=Christiangramia sediminicola TaxID=3073267 RepID=A0ABU1ENV3_9FLAO|nr:S41 family peptidase [Christiangramia sp. SM2212]MDR5590070.1 S41 family peptidase [Christiangramia sp. SM2212]